jgi:hypothetical protein
MPLCPLCREDAEFAWVERRNRKHFSCSICTEFQITVAAEKKVTTAPADWRHQMSAKAKAGGKDRVLVIFVPSSGMNQSLQAEFAARDQLPT